MTTVEEPVRDAQVSGYCDRCSSWHSPTKAEMVWHPPEDNRCVCPPWMECYCGGST